jgi:hypothetical protein
MKSEHNHFAIKGSKGSQQQRQKVRKDADDMVFVAIDNDRCMTPREVYAHPSVPAMHAARITLWESLVLNEIPCQNFPKDLVESILEQSSIFMTGTVSTRLKEALQQDPLADFLLASPSEAFDEIDDRVRNLVQRLQNCKLN